MFYYNIDREESFIDRICGLFERNAARTARTHLGNGAPRQHREQLGQHPRMTKGERATILRLAQLGRRPTEIAALTSRSQGTVSRLLLAAGITFPKGRAPKQT